MSRPLRRLKAAAHIQVKWTETAYERGSLVVATRWTAILAIVVRPPASAETLRKNPLGLYVDGIDWARELETAPPPAAAMPEARSAVSDMPLAPAIDAAAPALPERTVR